MARGEWVFEFFVIGLLSTLFSLVLGALTRFDVIATVLWYAGLAIAVSSLVMAVLLRVMHHARKEAPAAQVGRPPVRRLRVLLGCFIAGFGAFLFGYGASRYAGLLASDEENGLGLLPLQLGAALFFFVVVLLWSRRTDWPTRIVGGFLVLGGLALGWAIWFFIGTPGGPQ